MIQIGDLEIHLINDARILVDAGGAFGLVPRTLFSSYLMPDEQNRIPMDHYCLLVRGAGKTVVVDTGLGCEMPEKLARILNVTRPREGCLLEGLAAHGVQPEDVDIVVNTHLHNDHCGGNTRYDQAGKVVATFPRAEYLAPEREYQDALFPNERTRGTYFPVNYVPLYEAGQLTLIKGVHEVLPGMSIVPTPGHTPGHTSVVFESGKQAALYPADLSSFAIHFARLGWMTAYDVEPLVTLETKRIWQRWALQHNALLLFEHDPLIQVGRLAERGGGFEVIPAAQETA
ncbi:MAG: MBL fold metallo-hydrolase [Anaerolineae bacterium]